MRLTYTLVRQPHQFYHLREMNFALLKRILNVRIINKNGVSKGMKEFYDGIFLIRIKACESTVAIGKADLVEECTFIYHAKAVVIVLIQYLFKRLKTPIVHIRCGQRNVTHSGRPELTLVKMVAGC